MKLCVVVLALAACSQAQPQPHPIAVINPVIGDTSFIRAFGRFPTPADDVRVRVQTHVGYVARLLRSRDASQLTPELRARRAALLDELDRYVAAGLFPTSETDVGLLPSFLDRQSGVRCAVADLVEHTAGTELMTALDAAYHNAYVADLEQDARFVAWAATSGLSTEELEMIQPAYPPRPTLNLELGVTARSATAISDSPYQLGLVGVTLRRINEIRSHGVPYLEVDAAIGAAGPTDSTVAARGTTTDRTALAYDVAAIVGSRTQYYPMNGSWHEIGLAGGIELDRYGARIARGFTIPIDTWYRMHVNHDTLVGMHAGPRIGLGDRALGFSTGIDLVWRNRFVRRTDDGADCAPRDFTVSFDVARIAETLFAGVSIAFGARTNHGYWAGE